MIHVSLFGSVRVQGHSGRVADLQTRRGSELFAFLVLEAGRSFNRSQLIEQFWSHLPEGRGQSGSEHRAVASVAVSACSRDGYRAALSRGTGTVGYVRPPDTIGRCRRADGGDAGDPGNRPPRRRPKCDRSGRGGGRGVSGRSARDGLLRLVPAVAREPARPAHRGARVPARRRRWRARTGRAGCARAGRCWRSIRSWNMSTAP